MKAKKNETKSAATAEAPTPAPDGYLLKNEVAARLRKTPRTVELWMRDGIIPFIKLGKGKRATVLFSWPQVQAHLAQKFGVCGRALVR